MASLISQYSKEIVSILVPLLAWVLNGGLRRKARLIWTEQHSSSILTEENFSDGDEIKSRPTVVCTRSLYFKNVGSQPAKRVELVFNWRPQCMNLIPHRLYEEKVSPNGKFIIQIENLAPGEWFISDLFSVRELPNLVTVRCEQTIPKYIESSPQPVNSRRKLMMATYMMISGFIINVYASLVIIQYLIIGTTH